MKTTVKLTGILLMLMLAFNVSLNAQRGSRGMSDNTGMNRMRIASDTLHRQGMNLRRDSLRMRGMGPQQMGPGRMTPGGQFYARHPMYGMRNGMGRGPWMQRGMRDRMAAGSIGGMRRGMGNIDHNGWGPMNTQRLMMESIPNVTEKQKQEIADLRIKQQDEMKMFREEMAAKMQTMRETHKKSLLNILTDEQKKFLESKQGNTNTTTTPAKTK
jgi:hypothetical protein